MPRESDTLRAGDRAPAFTLPDQKGRPWSLDGLLAAGPLLLAFHRGTWWPNCRSRFGELAEHCSDYRAHGVQVVAVVAQRSEKVKRYIEDTGLPFNVLVDDTREVIKAYGVWHRVGIDAWNIARPALFLIDPQRAIRYVYVAARQDEFPSHEEISAAIASL